MRWFYDEQSPEIDDLFSRIQAACRLEVISLPEAEAVDVTLVWGEAMYRRIASRCTDHVTIVAAPSVYLHDKAEKRALWASLQSVLRL